MGASCVLCVHGSSPCVHPSAGQTARQVHASCGGSRERAGLEAWGNTGTRPGVGGLHAY